MLLIENHVSHPSSYGAFTGILSCIFFGDCGVCIALATGSCEKEAAFCERNGSLQSSHVDALGLFRNAHSEHWSSSS